MKKVLIMIAIFFPLFALSQCPNVVNVKPENALWLKDALQQHMGYELRRSQNPFSRSEIDYRDSSGFIMLGIFSKAEIKYNGLEKEQGELLTKNIAIIGPTDKILQFVELLKKEFAKCENFKTGGQWIKTKGMGIVFRELDKSRDEPPLTRITFEIE